MKKILIASLISTLLYAQDLTTIYSSFESGDYEDVITKLNSNEYSNFKDKKFLRVKHYLLGVSSARLQDFELAIEHFKTAKQLGSKAESISYELGQANFAINSLDNSIKNFKQSIKTKYKVEQSTYYVGHIYQLKDDHQSAKKYFTKLLKNKKTTTPMKQIAYFQTAESNLKIARETDRAAALVEKYILPDMYRALEIEPNNSVADDIEERIKEIKKEFYLEEGRLVNGATLPRERIAITLDEKITYDNNVTKADDLPSSTGTNKDSFYTETRATFSKATTFNRRYTLTPELELAYLKYANRIDSDIFSNDSYNIIPRIDLDFAYRYHKRAANFFLNYIYDYQARDINAEKKKIKNYYSNTLELGSSIPFFKFGDTTLNLKYLNYTYYTDTLDRSSLVASIDQIIRSRGFLYVLLYQIDDSNYEISESQNTLSNLFRFDFIYPSIIPNTTLNLGLSANFISYEDESEDEKRGLESTLTMNASLTRVINQHFSFGVDYTYTNNSSEEDTSNYTAHETTFEIGYNY